MLQINEHKDGFTRDGKPFFYMADTIWSAFSNITTEEWEEYLQLRRAQGFNTLQISILPIVHDKTESDLAAQPFHVEDDGSWNFDSVNEAFFERAVTMLETAERHGMIPALVVLWANYVKDTSFSNKTPEYIMTNDQIRKYTQYVVEQFGRFKPIYLISGDTNFGSDDSVNGYQTALETVKSMQPKALTTLHLQPKSDLHDAFVQSELVDFYMYQSGHHMEHQDFPYVLAEQFLSKPVKKPIVNGEPCYEGHGYGHAYGRFDAFDIRKATWQSLLAGAKAGITYGAHGVWSWHKKNGSFNNEKFSGLPYDWKTALRLPGAWDVSYAKWLFEQNEMYGLIPRNDLLLNDNKEIRLAATADMSKIVLYMPYNVPIRMGMDLTNYNWTAIDLASRQVIIPELDINREQSTIRMLDTNADILFVGEY